jgi:hypothetical protein
MSLFFSRHLSPTHNRAAAGRAYRDGQKRPAWSCTRSGCMFPRVAVSLDSIATGAVCREREGRPSILYVIYVYIYRAGSRHRYKTPKTEGIMRVNIMLDVQCQIKNPCPCNAMPNVQESTTDSCEIYRLQSESLNAYALAVVFQRK